jgi:hypothetical protein
MQPTTTTLDETFLSTTQVSLSQSAQRPLVLTPRRQFTSPSMSQFIAQTLKNIPGVDPRVAQRSQAFSALNDGPAETAARLAGLVQKEHAKDDSPL